MPNMGTKTRSAITNQEPGYLPSDGRWQSAGTNTKAPMTKYRSDVFWLRDQGTNEYHAHLGVTSLCGRHQMPAVIAKLLIPGEPICKQCATLFEDIPPELPEGKRTRKRKPTPTNFET